MRALFVACALPHRSLLQLHHKLSFTPKLAVVLLEFLTPQTILRQVIAGRTVLWEASKPSTRRMTMLRVLTRAGPTCLRHTVPVPARTGAGLQEGKHRSIRPCVGPKVHTGTALPSGSSWSRVGWRWRVKPPNAVTVAGGYAIAVPHSKPGPAANSGPWGDVVKANYAYVVAWPGSGNKPDQTTPPFCA